MKCPHLADWMYKACEATKKPYIPSPFQLKEYCKTEYHVKCPFYLDILDMRPFAETGKARNLVKAR